MNPQIFKVTRTPKDKNCTARVELTTLLDLYCAAINVSDSQCATFDLQRIGIPSFWFPINEIGMWGHGPFLGALRVVNEYYKGDKPVLIHCHAGANRSPSVAYAILLAKGYNPSEIEESLEYENLTQVFDRNVLRKHIPSNIIQFLKVAEENPSFSINGVLSAVDGLYDEWAQKKFSEQNNYVVKSSGNPDDETRLVYNREKKRFVLVKGKQ